MKSFFKAVATVTIFSIITRILGFFFRIFLSRKLGAEGLGLYQIASSVLGIFMTIIASGLPLTTAKLVSKCESENNISKRNNVVSSALIISIVVSLICSILIILFKGIWNIILTDRRTVEILLLLIPSIIFSAVYSIFRGALWGENDYFNCGLTELIEQVVRFLLTFILLLNISDIFYATKISVIAFDITCLVSAIIAMIIYLKRGKLNFKQGYYKTIIKSALPITGVRLSNSLVQPLTTILIPALLVLTGYTKTEAVKCFGVVMGMTFPMLFVPMAIVGSISMVLIPSISSMLAKNDYKSIEKNITTAFSSSLFLSAIFIPLYLSVGDKIGVVLYNNEYAGILLQLASATVVPITLCNLSGSILNALNLETKSFKHYIIGSAVLFICLIALTPLITINSIIVAYFISMSTISLLNIRKINKTLPDLNLNIYLINFKYALIILPSWLLGNFTSKISSHFCSAFFCAIFGGGISIVAFLILVSMFNVYNLKDLFNIITKRKQNTLNK